MTLKAYILNWLYAVLAATVLGGVRPAAVMRQLWIVAL